MLQVLNKRASTHPNHCEDNFWCVQTDQYIVGAVLDGCSTGIESHFASTLIKYCLDTYWNQTPEEMVGCDYGTYINSFLTSIWYDLDTIQRQLKLDNLKLLSTIVIFVYNKENKDLYVKFLGDGSVYTNQENYKHDEQNVPDYLAYHLSDCWSDFRHWVRTRKTLEIKNVVVFSICTDGIDSFVNLKNPHLDKNLAIDFLLNFNKFVNLKTGLTKRFNILTNKNEQIKESDELFCWDIADDLTVIHYNGNIQ